MVQKEATLEELLVWANANGYYAYKAHQEKDKVSNDNRYLEKTKSEQDRVLNLYTKYV